VLSVTTKGISVTFRKFLGSVSVDFKDLAMGPSGGGFNLVGMETAPLEFLMQAEKDFLAGGNSSLVNSVTNAKRAISCQMDQLLLTFGYQPYSWNIVKKLDNIRALGLLTPAILRKVAKTRNLLEHEYVKPTQHQVEESLDIATLFVMANVSLFNPFGDELEGGIADTWDPESMSYTKRVYFGLKTNEGRVYYSASVFEKNRFIDSYRIFNTDHIFLALVKLAVAYELNYKVDEAFDNLNAIYSQS
jgi:hypothetical protein